MINWLRYNGKDTRDLRIYIRNRKIDRAERDTSSVAIPGRSRDLVIDNGRYRNATITYSLLQEVRKVDQSDDNLNYKLSNSDTDGVFIPSVNYEKLEDSYDTDYFFLARLMSTSNPVRFYPRFETLDLKFTVDPYMYSREGQNKITKTMENPLTFTLRNPEKYESLPYIKITSNGNPILYVNGSNYYIVGVDEYIEIDSEMANCYKSTPTTIINENNKYRANSFPIFNPGINTITVVAASKIEIIPRWRKRV